MLALRGMYEEGKIELLDSPPKDTRSLIAVVFLDAGLDEIADVKETLLLAHSPVFKCLIEHSITEVEQGQTRPVQELLDELPD